MTRYVYDDNGRLLEEIRPHNRVVRTYGGFGRLADIANDDSRLVFSYSLGGDLLSQRNSGVTGVSLPDLTLDFGYDVTGVLATVSGPDGTRSYDFDGSGRLEQVTDNDGGIFRFSYDEVDRLVGIARPNGVDDVLTWRPDGKLASRLAVAGARTVSSFEYGYDTAGRG